MTLNANILLQNRIFVDSTYLTMIHTFYNTCYNKNCQQMRLFCFMSLFPFSRLLPYMFRAFISPSSGVSQVVVYMQPFGSCSVSVDYLRAPADWFVVVSSLY
jgi:hypothetical protein